MIEGFSSQRKLRTYSMSCIIVSTVQNQSCNKTRYRIHHHYLDFICNYLFLWSFPTCVLKSALYNTTQHIISQLSTAQ